MLSFPWQVTAGTMFAGLFALSYGFNNLPFPAGPFRMPLVDVLLVALAVVSRATWSQHIRESREGRALRVAFVGLVAVAAVRLTMDVPRYGVLAVRDALYVVDVLAVFVGMALARSVSSERLRQSLQLMLCVSVTWFVLYPIHGALEMMSPVVGVQRAVPLAAFNSASWGGAIALLWFTSRRRVNWACAALAAAAVLLAQSRTIYLSLPVAIAIAVWVARSSSGRVTQDHQRHFRASRVLLPLMLALVAFALLPPLPGRLAAVRPQFIGEQIGTLFGKKGAGSGSLAAREQWWPSVLAKVRAAPSGEIVGVGFGPDLIGGFRSRGGADVRKPHNDLLEMFARTGILGLSAWLAVVGIAVAGVYRRARTGSDIARWALPACVVLLGHALTQPLFAFAYGGMTFWLLLGIGLGSPTTAEPACPASATRDQP
jgi:hypothetical protein